MSGNKSFYITTTLPYLNADPHIGHAFEFIQADIIARYKRLVGNEVFFNTGTDEHGLKIYRKAFDVKMDTQDYVDLYVLRFKALKESLNLSYTNFIRTTDPHHIAAAQTFWNICLKNGDIYKKEYKAKYCVGCEMERHDSELENNRCFLHPNLKLEIIEEVNYFFRFSKFQEPLLQLYKQNPDFVLPSTRLNEIEAFVERGLEDFSISRLKSKMPWGIDVPNDPEHTMFVWFDALVNYVSVIGWPTNTEEFKKWWPVTQYAGKDNLRQQSAIWQAMLMSAGLTPSKQIVIHGHITSEGRKMSKSLGNIIDPVRLIEDYGTDAFRYYIAREVNSFEDSDVTIEKFKEAYNANLANGLGNLVSRIMKLAETHLSKPVTVKSSAFNKEVELLLDKFEIQKAMNYIWSQIGELDALIQEKKPWDSKDKEVITNLVVKLAHIGYSLEPFMPETSEKILMAIKKNKMPKIPLFPRRD